MCSTPYTQMCVVDCRVAVNKWLIWSLQHTVVHPMINNLYANLRVNYYYECKASNFRWIGFFITSSGFGTVGTHLMLRSGCVDHHLSQSLVININFCYFWIICFYFPSSKAKDENRSVTCNRLGPTFPMTRIKPEFIIEYFHHIQRVFARARARVQLGPGESCVCIVVIRTYIVRMGQGNGISFKMHKRTWIESTHGMSSRGYSMPYKWSRQKLSYTLSCCFYLLSACCLWCSE